MITTVVYEDVREAAACVRRGGVCAFPTETVFGLAVDAYDRRATARLFEAKGRPSDNPLIVHLADKAAWHTVARAMTTSAERLLDAFSPGPITVVLPKLGRIADAVTGGLDTVGVRIPANVRAREFLAHIDRPVAAPSANLSGKPSCTTWQAVLEDMDGRIDGILVGEPSSIGLESTVVDCTGDEPILLRRGSVSLEQLREVVPNMQVLSTSQTGAETSVNSPGLRHPHYRPEARVVLVSAIENGERVDLESVVGEPLAAKIVFLGMHRPSELSGFGYCQVFGTVDGFAAGFYEALRQADRENAACIVIESVQDASVGAALHDRQCRAAGLR